MVNFLDVCRFTPTLGGTTDWTYSAAVTGYQSPTAAGAVNTAVYRYRAESADLTQWEIGFGAYNSGTGVFARTTVLFNSLGTTARVSFSAVPQVAIVALAEDLTVTTPAAKSDQQVPASNALAVTPLHQQDHPSAAKAWVYFDGKTGGVATVKSSYGVASVVRNSAGNYTINWATAFASATAYAVQILASDPGVTFGAPFLNGTPLTAGSTTVSIRDILNPTIPTDMAIVMVCAFGGQ